MSDAITICAEAYRQANLDQELTSFSTSQEFPYNNALGILRHVVREMNRLGNYWFTETSTNLSYSAGVYQYSFSTLGIDPRRITEIRRSAADYLGVLEPLNYKQFQKKYRGSAIQTTMPSAFSKYGDTLEFNVIPDQDYEIKVFHFNDIPLPTATDSTFPIPEDDEDVLIDGVYAYLLQRMGRPDFMEAYQVFSKKAKDLLADMKQDQGMSHQMPSNF